ncbi:MAG: hydroxymethylglutaryl-CoA lyase [Alphaproteobacteria bacterium]
MSDLPSRVEINEEGPREGFQIEPGPIPTERKIELIDALSETGVGKIQVASLVNPKKVPGWADADTVIRGFRRKPGVDYHVLWLNERGLERALDYEGLEMVGSISTTASETFMRRNTDRGFAQNLQVQRNQIATYRQHGIPLKRASVMAAFGCNYEGEVPVEKVVDACASLIDLAREEGLELEVLSLADTMGWGNPESVKRRVGAVRERWPEKRICLHLHDTRGMGVANAYAGLQMGVDMFDSTVGGLGGCPFAAHKGAAGNVATEELVFLCHEMGIETGIDLDRLLDCAHLAEDIVGHVLPSEMIRGGSLNKHRAAH